MLDRYTYPTTALNSAIDTAFPIVLILMALVFFAVLAAIYDRFLAYLNKDRRPDAPGPGAGRGAGTHPSSGPSPTKPFRPTHLHVETQPMTDHFDLTFLHVDPANTAATWETQHQWPIDYFHDGTMYPRAALESCLLRLTKIKDTHPTLIAWKLHHGPRLVADSHGYRADVADAIMYTPRATVTHHRG